MDRGLIAPEDADPRSRSLVAAMRFVVAHLNGDAALKVALFEAGAAGSDVAELPAGLIKLAGAYGRRRLGRQ